VKDSAGRTASREIPDKLPALPQSSSRTRKTFQLQSRDCRNLVPEI
jgi:hypothetical protein